MIRIVILEGPMARFGAWWDGLSVRERYLVGTLGALLAALILVYGVIKPLQSMRAQALADIRTYETLNARIRAAGVLGPSGPPPRVGPADGILTASASATGLVASAERIPGGIRATVADASYDSVMTWLADLARTSSLTVTRVDLQRRAEPGRVTAIVEVRE